MHTTDTFRHYLQARARRAACTRPTWPFRSLEDLVTSPEGFQLGTATALQRAICRLVDGRPLDELATHPDVVTALGDPGAVAALDGVRPQEWILLAGVRTAKSLFAAACAIYATQTVDVSLVGPSDEIRYSIVSTKKDLAQAIFRHVRYTVENRPALRELLVCEPTKGMVVLRHPTGREIQITVAAGARAGDTLVARWSAGFAADEAPRMIGRSEGVVNLNDSIDALEGRLLPGAQIALIGSPWAPFGPVYDRVIEHEGRPSEDIVVVRARGDMLNPYWWTRHRAERLRRRCERTGSVAYRTDFLAQFADIEEQLIPSDVIDACTRKGPATLPWAEGHDYSAAMDPATRSNAWTWAVADRVGSKKRIVHADERVPGGTPLRPRDVMRDISADLHRYGGLDWCFSDQFAGDFLVDIGAELPPPPDGPGKLDVLVEPWTTKQTTDAFLALRDAMAEGQFEIPDMPQFKKDLRMIKKRVTQSGVSIILPKTADGRHCDYAPVAAKAVHRWLDDTREVPPDPGTPERGNYEARRRMKKAMKAVRGHRSQPWWAK